MTFDVRYRIMTFANLISCNCERDHNYVRYDIDIIDEFSLELHNFVGVTPDKHYNYFNKFLHHKDK